MQIGDFLNRLDKCTPAKGGGWVSRCPAHADKIPSLSVKEGNDGRILLKCHAGCEADSVAGALSLKLSDLFVEKSNGNGKVIDATYDYRDEAGNLLFQAIRYTPKGFSQRRPDGAGGFIYNLQGVPRVLYRLRELNAADLAAFVFLVEGEKDVERLRAGGLVATCSPMGAGKWRDEYAQSLAGRKVVIIPDNDDPGRNHAQAEAQSLRGVAASVKMLTLSGLPEKGDVSDWLSLGGTIETLCAMAEAAPEWTPGAAPEPKAKRLSVSWAELCELKLERRETVLHEVERGEIVMCPAITNRGKTTYWRNATLSAACGREFLPIVPGGTPRVVLYLDFETRLYRARADITKMLGELSEDERRQVGANFHLIADCRINGRPLTLSDPSHLTAVAAEAEQLRADILIIDTLTAAFEIADENSNAEAARVMKMICGLAVKLNCVIVFLHHVGKQKLEEGQAVHAVHRARGASAYSGFSHAIYGLLPHHVDPSMNVIECAKVKGEKFDDQVVKLDPETRWFSNKIEAAKPLTTRQRVVGIFNGKPLKTSEVIDLLPGIQERRIKEALQEALTVGELTQPKRGLYQKPGAKSESAESAPPIESAQTALSSQTDEEEELSLDFSDFDEGGENSDPHFRHPDEYDDEVPF